MKIFTENPGLKKSPDFFVLIFLSCWPIGTGLNSTLGFMKIEL